MSKSNEIFIYESIGAGFADRFKTQLAAFAGKPVTVRINSPGGSVFEGIAAYELLKAHQGRITVLVDGIAASIGSIIAMAGSEIRMGGASMLMIHDASLATHGTVRQLLKDAGTLEKISNALAGIYADRTKKPLEEIRKLMLEETWLTAAECVKLGFADKIDATAKPAATASWKAADCRLALPFAARVAAGLTAPTPTRRETSAELDKLRAENAALKAQLATAAVPELDKLRAEYGKLKDPEAKRKYRLQHWAKFNVKI